MAPFAFFTYKKILMSKMRNRLLALLGLGGLQGMIGWWMVKSGSRLNPTTKIDPESLLTDS